MACGPIGAEDSIDMISSATSTAVSSIHSGLKQFDAAAQTVACGGVGDNRELTEALVAGQQARQQIEASAKVLSAADEMLGTLIDRFA
jgi:hypothetical protein